LAEKGSIVTATQRNDSQNGPELDPLAESYTNSSEAEGFKNADSLWSNIQEFLQQNFCSAVLAEEVTEL